MSAVEQPEAVAATAQTNQSAFDIDLPSTSYAAGHPLHFDSLPSKSIAGFWYIVGSSLPLWKPKKNVVIRYVPNATAKDGQVKFDDEIRSDNRSKTVDNPHGKDLDAKWKAEEGLMNKFFGIKGTNVLQKDAQNGASFQWTGNGLLKFFHSKWQVIGYGPYDLTDTSRTKFDWVVTYFEKTPATPSGIDVYVRDPQAMPPATYQAILEQMKQFESKCADETDPRRKALAKELTKLASESFEVPHDL
ncbi:hypothetical protein BCV70DRAFT_201780 [Testicularia cyperi]|uniref:Uncharacterized protein n=1 Tax=Testicularia cyperi TaxID=1882483 RepID=A0A317XK89_9BASI|nr:hypothetical protein BCV70DRAFT_201780 [Testicularia cyperi]